MTFDGGDPIEMTGLGQRLNTHADLLDAIRVTVDGRMSTGSWFGSDADTFHHDWRSRHAPSITSAASMLRTSAQTLFVNARQQEAASESGGVAADGFVAGPTGDIGRVVPVPLPGVTVAAGVVSGLDALLSIDDGLLNTTLKEQAGGAKSLAEVAQRMGPEWAPTAKALHGLPYVSAALSGWELGTALAEHKWNEAAYDTIEAGLTVASVAFPPLGIAAGAVGLIGLIPGAKEAIGGAVVEGVSSYASEVMHPFEGGITVRNIGYLTNPVTAGPIIASAGVQAGVKLFHHIFD